MRKACKYRLIQLCYILFGAWGESRTLTLFRRRILSPLCLPFHHPGKPRRLLYVFKTICGAGKRSRTSDLRITNALLYQLSYAGYKELRIIEKKPASIKKCSYLDFQLPSFYLRFTEGTGKVDSQRKILSIVRFF